MPDFDDDIMKSESGLSELSNEELYFRKKTMYQQEALFYKNVNLQMRKKMANFLWIGAPVIGLSFIWLLS